MKITQKSSYSPITIVLETEDEAIMMWHIANQTLRPDYIHDYGINPAQDRIKYNLWANMDGLVHPLMV